MSEERYHITYAEKRHPDAPDEYIIASDAQLTMYDHAEELHMACEHAIAMMEDVPGAKDFFSVRAELRSIIYRCQGQTPPDSDTDAFLMMFWLRSKGRCGADAKNSCRRIEQCQRTEKGGRVMSDELKKCPFCGGEAEVTRTERSRTFGPIVFVGCANPKCNAFSEPMAFAKSVWNQRPVEDDLRAKWESVPWEAINNALYLAEEYAKYHLAQSFGDDTDYDAELRAVDEWVRSNAPTKEPAE